MGKTTEIANLSKINIVSEIKNYNINFQIQSKEDVIKDLLSGRGKESYLSLSINENIIKNKEIETNNTKKKHINFQWYIQFQYI